MVQVMFYEDIKVHNTLYVLLGNLSTWYKLCCIRTFKYMVQVMFYQGPFKYIVQVWGANKL